MDKEEPSTDTAETPSKTVDNESTESGSKVSIDSTENYESSEKKFDIVAIHGLGSHEGKQWSSSKSTSWLLDLAAQKKWEVRVIQYTYDTTKIIEATYADDAISAEASRLLQKLTQVLRAPADFSQMFFGCPHRTMGNHRDTETLSAKLRLLDETASKAADLNMDGLARSIIDANTSFLNTRVLTRANVMNVVTTKTAPADMVFNNYEASVGIPLEKLLFVGSPHKDLVLEPTGDNWHAIYGGYQTNRVSSFPWREDRLSSFMSAIESQAAPIYPLKLHPEPKFDWLDEKAKYLEWRKPRSFDLLHIHGAFGISDLAEYVYQEVVDTEKGATFRAVLYFKFDKYDERRNSIGAMANSLLLQVLSHVRQSPNSVMPEIEPPDFSDCWTDEDAFFFLEKLMRDIGTTGHIHWILDGLDQCDESSRWLFSMISDFARNSEQGFKILITSVDDSHIREGLSEFRSIDLRQQAPTADFIESSATEFMTTLCQIRPQFRHVEPTIRQLLESCGHDYVLRRLLFEWLVVAPCPSTKSALEQELASLSPLSPAKIFEKCLDAVPENSRTWARKILMWMLISARPMTPEELGSALNLHASMDSASVEQHKYEDLMWDVSHCFGPMICLDHGLVQFRHSAARDFLTTKTAAWEEKRPWYALTSPEVGHREITDACIGFLTLPSTQDKILAACKSCPIDQRIFENPSDITSYVIEYWMLHYRKGYSTEYSNLPTSNVTGFLNDEKALQCWAAARWYLSNPHIRADRSSLSPLPILASIGGEDLVKARIESDIPSDKCDVLQALIEASRYGHDDVVELLLQNSSIDEAVCLEAIMVAARSAELKTLDILLAYATENLHIAKWPGMLTSRLAYLGSPEQLKIVLQAGADANSRDSEFSPPIHCAIVRDNIEALDVLMEHGADPTTINSNWMDTPPIMVAAKFSRGHMVDRLSKAPVDAQDEKGRTALWFAAGKGQHAVFRALLGAGADKEVLTTNVRGNRAALIPLTGIAYPKCLRAALDFGVDLNQKLRDARPFNVLSIAARWAHVEVCRMLLEHGTCQESEEDPPLIHAARSGSTEIVEMLLKEGHKIDVKIDDDFARTTPLVAAARDGHKEIVTKLIEKGANIEYTSPEGNTPLISAIAATEPTIAKMLLDAGADINATDSAGWSSVHLSYSKLECMKILLDAGADVNSPGPDGTPFYLAAFYGQVEVVKLLLSHNPDLETRCPDGNFTDVGYAPVHCTASAGYINTLRLLLEAGADIETKTPKGGTPLILAAANSQEESVKVLLEYKLDIDAIDIWGGTALFCVPSPAPLSLVKRLLNRGTNLTIQNEDKYTILGKAIENEDIPFVKLLLEKKVDINLPAVSKLPALHIVAAKCDLDLVKLLIEKGADPVLTHSWMYGTPLQRVFEKQATTVKDKDAVARYLINDIGVDVNVHGGNFGSVLNAAILTGTIDTIKLIIEKGADIGWSDLLGRRPIHFAALKTSDHFQLLLESSSDDEKTLGITSKTKTGLTVLHFAVATGRPDLVELVISRTRGTISIDEPDEDGWTPLLWACRLCNEWDAPDQISPAVVKLLLDHGADPWVRGRTYDDRQWSPLKMARFHGASQEVVKLLKESHCNGREEEWKSKFHSSKKGARSTWFCDMCLFRIYGNVHFCKDCGSSFGLCFKCFRYKKELHPYHDNWEVKGPEFDDDQEEEEKDEEEDEDEPKGSPGIEQVQDDDSEGDWSNDEAEGGESAKGESK
ncbi:hypothetical protein IL306_013723 [Fusarium sp. DS 682]|nr:hypothetical protein IL306_013723 [Fusarium sp. DS 682]